jgi:hypothetical protein
MRLTDFSPSIQLILFGLLAVALALPLIRVLVFLYREKVGVPTAYPKNWSAAQCRALEWFRLLVGLGLIPLWGSFLFIVHWPFKFWDLFYFIVLLLITSSWLKFLDQRNWKKSGGRPRSFWKTITFPIVWWGVAFTATEWMFASFQQDYRTALARRPPSRAVQIRCSRVRRPTAIGEPTLLEYVDSSGRLTYQRPTNLAPRSMVFRLSESLPTLD